MAQVKWLIIGHRGTGKTSLLKRIESYYASSGREVTCLDLDHEIEENEGLKVDEIFASHGEKYFRECELRQLQNLAHQFAKESDDVYVACGAGLELTENHFGFKTLWARRSTDKSGRIFFNRPRLDSNTTPLEEFQARFSLREPRYQAHADETLTLREGFDFVNPYERQYFLDEIKNVGGVVTVLPQHFERSPEAFIERRLKWGLEFFELRDDLLSEKQFEQVLTLAGQEKLLVSFREKSRTAATQKFVQTHNLKFDWPLDWPKPFANGYIGSLHPRSANLDLNELDRRAGEFTLLKLAVPIQTFAELQKLHEWHLRNPGKNVFLPMSDTGRWRWYRLLMQNKSRLQFWRDGESVAADQPLLMEWLAQKEFAQAKNFAAILGDPVEQSRTPAEQHTFFKDKNMNVYAVQVSENEFTQNTLDFLHSLGLTAAAVTSPLKPKAFELAQSKDSISQKLQVSNTLKFVKNAWHSANTDFGGLKALLESADLSGIRPSEIAVWGGGGVLGVLREHLPQAHYYSVRTGLPREGSSQNNPKAVVWAATYKKDQGAPPKTWNPEIIIDLNYAENSEARTYALQKGTKYLSGLGMFLAQAKLQREFWERDVSSAPAD